MFQLSIRSSRIIVFISLSKQKTKKLEFIGAPYAVIENSRDTNVVHIDVQLSRKVFAHMNYLCLPTCYYIFIFYVLCIRRRLKHVLLCMVKLHSTSRSKCIKTIIRTCVCTVSIKLFVWQILVREKGAHQTQTIPGISIEVLHWCCGQYWYWY